MDVKYGILLKNQPSDDKYPTLINNFVLTAAPFSKPIDKESKNNNDNNDNNDNKKGNKNK